MTMAAFSYPFAATSRCVECAGWTYFNTITLANNDDVLDNDSDNRSEEEGEEFSVDIMYLKSLDPKEWKEQDHYAVLGLANLRYDATEDEIKRAYRRMVLKHHPDKRKAKGEEVDTETDYFTCITKAYDILGITKSRRAYDSVDPKFDDNLPTESEFTKDFYGVFRKCFDLNGRWSEIKPVPSFGDANSTRAEVDQFYTFWYSFKSSREYSYLDEEDKERGQDRDERRWIEKENKAARIKRKKEEMIRIRALVDLAYNNDKRIIKFKNEEKEKKLAAKRAKMDAVQAAKAEQERAIREAQQLKEKAEKAEQKRIEQLRMEKEQQKKAIKKERKTLRDKGKENKYFSKDNDDNSIIKNMEGLEKICETFNLVELQKLNNEMKISPKDAFFNAIQIAEKRIQNELDSFNNHHTKKQITKSTDVREIKKHEIWCNENVQLLIKAVNLFPAGTAQRWDVIAAFINQHATNIELNITARDVLNKAKSLQSSDFSKNSLKSQANKEAFESFEKSKKDVQTCNDITVNNTLATAASTNGVVKQNGQNGISNTTKPATTTGTTKTGAVKTEKIKNVAEKTEKSEKQTKLITNAEQNNNPQQNGVKQTQKQSQQQQPISNGYHHQNISGGGTTTTTTTTAAALKQWTKEEQALLEQAIKSFPNNTPDRWDRIAECIPNRTKKDCMRRVKELVDLVNSKKEAQIAAK